MDEADEGTLRRTVPSIEHVDTISQGACVGHSAHARPGRLARRPWLVSGAAVEVICIVPRSANLFQADVVGAVEEGQQVAVAHKRLLYLSLL